VDFLRKSNDGRVTLALDPSAAPVRSLWAIMDATDAAAAVVALRDREGILVKYEKEHVGVWTGGSSPVLIPNLAAWAQAYGIEGIVWANLPRKFDDLKVAATADQIVAYLRGLTGRLRDDAERYVRRAPAQIDTPYRRAIEATLGWTPLTTEIK